MPAFLFLWISLIIVNPTSNAVIALTFAHHVLQPFFPSCEIPETPVRLLAICITALLTYINCYNVRWATRTQDASTVTKVGALILIILVGLAQILFGESENFDWSNIRGEQPTPVGIALGFYAGVFSFSGWNYLNFVTEEIKDPNRNLPRAIYISLPIVTLIYMLVNVAYFAVLSADEVLESNAVAVTFADRMLGPVAMVMPLFVAISCIGGLNGIIFTCSRMFFAGARDGQLPELLAMINVNFLTPMPSLLFLGILSVGMIFVSDIYILINYLAFTECSVVAMSVLSLLKLRLTRPDLKRPIKFHLAIPILFLIICAYILSVPFVTSPYELIVAVIIITSGIPFYFVFVYWQDKPKTLYRPWIALTHWTQKFLYCVP
ncbi:Amino acid permease family protein [Aphelenchoides avenae]|nr:Amino acid permease family protein [Aphelenchus avenae]